MKRKITVILVFMMLFILAVISRLFFIQFVQAEEMAEKAENHRIKDLLVPASRGTIFDRNGNKLAISITAETITASPPDIIASQEVAKIAAFLAATLDMDVQKVKESITKDKPFSYVKRKVDFAAADAIRQAKLPGIHITGEPKRFYPKGMLAANVIGYAGLDNEGLEGVEYVLDSILQGQPGRIIGAYDANGYSLPQGRLIYVPPSDGYDIYLTLDENIQFFCERELDNLMISLSAPKAAGIIVMRPDTGEILAMAQRPSYDPNYFATASLQTQRNILVSDVYEPGSTFKIITAAAALEEGTASLESRYHDSGYVKIYDAKINCWRNYNPHGSQSFTEAMMNSCNPALIEIGQSLQAKEKGLFYKYIRAFGFGSPTGVQLSGEARGLLQDEKRMGPVGLATTCIGQGISVTPMQMISAVCAVANGGKLLKPQIVSKIMDGDTIIKDFEPELVRQVISAETAQTLRGVLEYVVAGNGEANGTGSNAYIDGYRVGGKTGTAQKPGPGGYLAGKFVGSFVGMAPINDPQVACLVFVDEAVEGHHQGSVAAAPVFKAVMEDTMRYLGVVPQITDKSSADENPIEQTQAPDLRGLNATAARDVLFLAGLKAEIRGDGIIVDSQDPLPFSIVNAGSTVTVTLGGSSHEEQIIVPDIIGKRLSMAAEILMAAGLKISAAGTEGLAYAQDPSPGRLVEAGSAVLVRFDDSIQ
ncbi:MAG: penicillin-binding transpeptidase domain-containing protein [Clostridiales bacterium]|nr:penicillin-binding transpeptidase domain-containing protein [Clostridiales bacterium]